MLSPVFCACMVEDEETGLVPGQIGERKMEELLAIGGISALSASAFEEGIGEASGGSGRIDRFLLLNAAVNHAANRGSKDVCEPAPAT